MRSGSLLMRKSIDITVGGNFADYSSIIMHERSSKPVGQPFMPNAGSLMGPGVWLVGKDSDGSLIHTYAARSVNSTGQTLAEFLSVNFKSFAPSSPTSTWHAQHIDHRMVPKRCGAPGYILANFGSTRISAGD